MASTQAFWKSLTANNRSDADESGRQLTLDYIRLKFLSDGLRSASRSNSSMLPAEQLLSAAGLHRRLTGTIKAPVDQRIEQFLDEHFEDVASRGTLRLPNSTLVLDRVGIARELSLPVNGTTYTNEYVSSYRVRNGVLHNPWQDRRTTKGTFHIALGGLPIPDDKKAVPKSVFARLFTASFSPPDGMLVLPFCSEDEEKIKTMVSLLIRPLVVPEVPGFCKLRSMEIRFFAPAGLVSNLDFVESIFGNAGDPFLPDNDAGLDINHWSGHTGCVILAPHLCRISKKSLGLPHFDSATERERRDGMCYRSETELYNEGQPFKLTCRTNAGVIVTLIADNYYGYCKKEVKTQISYATNLYGNVEEEHAGGAIAFPSFTLGEEFRADSRRYNGRTFADVARDYGNDFIDVRPEGFGVDKKFPNLIYIPEDAQATLSEQRIKWIRDGKELSIPLLPGQVYMAPSGYRIRMEKHPAAPSWRLIGTAGEGTFCHKPSTVSGGGKSEISKSLVDFMLYGPVYVQDLQKDFDLVQEIFDHDYSNRWRDDSSIRPSYDGKKSRHVLDPNRSLGSVIKLLTPSEDYTDEHNRWLRSLPNHVLSLVFVIKRFQQGEWSDWRKDFSVDIVNGFPGHELKYRSRKVVGTYLRVGVDQNQSWRTYKLRQDFSSSMKIATEDDISVSFVVPSNPFQTLASGTDAPSVKFTENCEFRLFQRPDEAIHRGLDKQAEADLARNNNFISNFEPLDVDQVRDMVKYVVDLDKFTAPMQELLKTMATDGKGGYVVCSSMPRVINGVRSQNPRYLQDRPDLVNAADTYIGRMGTRLFRAIPSDKPVPLPVNAVLFGRRNNPPDQQAGLRGLAVYGPLHYQELPELFMDFVSSLTGKSPSTTGAGSEGALTKGPFNALPPIYDLNSALVSFILTDLAGFSSAAGYIGPNMQIDHDISLLVPEIWCRLSPEERLPKYLIENQFLEKVADFDFGGERILASRLGYRITKRFVRSYLGRIFDNPAYVFDEAILRPESQDLASFADGVKYVCEAHQRVAGLYFADGSVESAVPPLQALLHIMHYGSWKGMTLDAPEVRQMFTRESLLSSDWYRDRLKTKQRVDLAFCERQEEYVSKFLQNPHHSESVERLRLEERLKQVRIEKAKISSPEYLKSLSGMLGCDPAIWS